MIITRSCRHPTTTTITTTTTRGRAVMPSVSQGVITALHQVKLCCVEDHHRERVPPLHLHLKWGKGEGRAASNIFTGTQHHRHTGKWNLHGGTGGARTQGCVGSVGERSSCRFSSSDSETPVGCVSSFPMPRTAVPRQGSFCTRVPRGQVGGQKVTSPIHTQHARGGGGREESHGNEMGEQWGHKWGVWGDGGESTANTYLLSGRGGRRSEASICSACMLSGIGVMQSFPSFRRPSHPARGAGHVHQS